MAQGGQHGGGGIVVMNQRQRGRRRTPARRAFAGESAEGAPTRPIETATTQNHAAGAGPVTEFGFHCRHRLRLFRRPRRCLFVDWAGRRLIKCCGGDQYRALQRTNAGGCQLCNRRPLRQMAGQRQQQPILRPENRRRRAGMGCDTQQAQRRMPLVAASHANHRAFVPAGRYPSAQFAGAPNDQSHRSFHCLAEGFDSPTYEYTIFACAARPPQKRFLLLLWHSFCPGAIFSAALRCLRSDRLSQSNARRRHGRAGYPA